jgi:putative ABC transport system permease protein
MKTPLLRGRVFDDRDRQGMPSVMIVNETLARRYFAGQDPIERTVKTPHGAAKVVGVVADTHHQGLDSEPRPEIFLPFLQNAFGGMAVVVRTTSDPDLYAAAIRREVAQVDPSQPIFDLRSMDDVVSKSVFVPRVSMLLLGAFAGAALLMAIVGIYGVISYSVSQRTREFGLRMALGAQAGDTMRLVVGRSMMLVMAGLALGLVGAIATTRVLSGMLHGVSALDPLVFVGVSVVLIATAFLACVLPARRAAAIDPIDALRVE